MLVISNNEWIVPAGMNARRFAVLDVAEGRMCDIAYFNAMMRQMENGGYEALLYHLLHEVDLSGVDLRNAPKTSALLEQKIASFSPEQGWWFDTLAKGQLPWGCGEATSNSCPVDRLFNRYTEHARVTLGSRRRALKTQLGIFLKKVVPGLVKVDTTYKVYLEKHNAMVDQRGYVYRFPPLADCRAAFAKAMQQDIDWSADENKAEGWNDDGVWLIEPTPDGLGAGDVSDEDIEAAVMKEAGRAAAKKVKTA